MSEFLTLYQACRDNEVDDIKQEDDFTELSFKAKTFNGWLCKMSLAEQEANVKKNYNVFSCDLMLSKIARKRDIKRDFSALEIICKEIGINDFVFADMIADLVFESPLNRATKYNDVTDRLSLNIPSEKVPHDEDEKKAQILKFAQYEIMRLMGQIALSQGFDAVYIFRPNSKDFLVVNPKVEWNKVQ